jgi:hypothetical protein
VSFESVSAELYGLTPNDFTSARNTRVSDARKSGDAALADSLKKLHKPTVGAWLTNMLVRERSDELERLITLGTELRKRGNRADGELIRTVSKRKQTAIATLLSEARTIARDRGQPVSEAAARELESTLDAAFADPDAAESVRAGRLSAALHYSGLGLAEAGSDSSVPATKIERSREEMSAAKRDLELATHEAHAADAEAERTRRAVTLAEDDLKRLKTAAALAFRRATDAHKRVTAAKRKLDR